MIKIGKTIKELDLLAEAFYNEIETKLKLSKAISKKISEAQAKGVIAEENFYKYALNNLKDIITGKPSQLENLLADLEIRFLSWLTDRINSKPLVARNRGKERTLLKNEILSVFNYVRFTNNFDWAYAHSSSLGLSVCPYCNANYTFTLKTRSAKTRPQFDHFFNKSKYPFFALSFYNLIPSCYSCNSNLKNQKKFKPSTHIHPFIEGTEDVIQFGTKISKVDFLVNQKDFEILIKQNTSSPKLTRAMKSAKDFIIEEHYAFHKIYASEVIYKSYVYSESKIKELLEEFQKTNGSKIFSSKEEITEMLFGNHLREDKLHERPLAKLTKNIANEFGIII